MVYKVRRSLAARGDIEAIFDFLVESFEGLGDVAGAAFERAVLRIEQIEDAMEALGAAPHQGTLWPEVMPGLRWTTKDRAIFYFIVDDDACRLDVLAVFFGGQDHKRHILDRIKSSPAPGP